MDFISLLILGAVQGATEFLPVSSSGHLAMVSKLLERGRFLALLEESPLMLEILLHLATLLAVTLFYRRDILKAIIGFGRLLAAVRSSGMRRHLEADEDARLALAVIVGTLPTACLGVLLKGAVETVSQAPLLLGLSFLFCAAVLFGSRFFPGGDRPLTLPLALVIGTAQGIAVFPGVSRSGITIAVALALGLGRAAAVRFSFLLSLPAILGAALLELDLSALTGGENLPLYLAGTAAAFAVGLLSLFALVYLVNKGRLWLFAPYVTLAGLFCIFYLG